MTSEQPALLLIAKAYLKAIEDGKTAEELDQYYDASVEQIEYPNLLLPKGATRNLNDLKEASRRGQQVIVRQTYDIQKSYVVCNTVILESIWTAVLAIPIGNTPAGGEMKAYFAQFIEFENCKIIRQRTYDCFEPF